MEDFDWTINAGDKGVIPAMVYHHVRKAVTRYRDLLHRDSRRGPLDRVAWLTRNILELQVWTEYCADSSDRAITFFFDAVRDLNDLNRDGKELDPTTLDTLRKATSLLDPSRRPHQYVDVKDAAKEIGLYPQYKNVNKILSKFVHPTAMSVMLPIADENSRAIRKQLVDSGEQRARATLDRLDNSMLGATYQKYRQPMHVTNAQLRRQERVL